MRNSTHSTYDLISNKTPFRGTIGNYGRTDVSDRATNI
jgi:hypothetical protein